MRYQAYALLRYLIKSLISNQPTSPTSIYFALELRDTV